MIKNLPHTLRAFFAAVFLLTLTPGCGRPPVEESPTFSQAHQEFLQILKDEYNLELVTRELDNTLWLYLPLEEPLFDYAADDKGVQVSREAKKLPAINFLDGEFADGAFKIEFDISQSRKYAKSPGFSSKYSESYSEKQREALTALSRAYFKVEREDEVKKLPDFVVFVIADISRGIEIKMLFHLEDIRRGMMDQTFYEEYTRRLVVEEPAGHLGIIGDKTGSHLDYKEITWPSFLTRQMLYRIRLKYQQSAFPPSEDSKEELSQIAARTLGAYDFKDFDAVELHDLDSEAVYTIGKEALKKYKGQDLPPGGKIHVIKFR